MCGKHNTSLEERSAFNVQKACSQVLSQAKTTVSLVNLFKGCGKVGGKRRVKTS